MKKLILITHLIRSVIMAFIWDKIDADGDMDNLYQDEQALMATMEVSQ